MTSEHMHKQNINSSYIKQEFTMG